MTDGNYRLVVTAIADRSLGRLPEGVAAAIVKFLLGSLVEAPARIGQPLPRQLAGLWSVRRGPNWVIYEIVDEDCSVRVLRVDHRADVYRRR